MAESIVSVYLVHTSSSVRDHFCVVIRGLFSHFSFAFFFFRDSGSMIILLTQCVVGV